MFVIFNLCCVVLLSSSDATILTLSCAFVVFDLDNIFKVCVSILCDRVENMARKAAGEEPLPEEDPSNPIFKPIPEPSRLDSYLITNQISNYCNQINGYASVIKSHLET